MGGEFLRERQIEREKRLSLSLLLIVDLDRSAINRGAQTILIDRGGNLLPIEIDGDRATLSSSLENYKSGNLAPKRNRPLLLLLLKAKMLGSSSALKSSFVLALLLVSFLIVSPMAVQAQRGRGGGSGVSTGGNRNSTESSAATGQNFALEAVAPLAFLYLLSLW